MRGAPAGATVCAEASAAVAPIVRRATTRDDERVPDGPTILTEVPA